MTQTPTKRLLIFTGPAGAGKNTIANLLAKQLTKCVVIDVDVVRWMVAQPHKAPWDGEEGVKQQELGVENACMLAKNFLQHGYDVVVLDVISDKTARMYKESLAEHNPIIALLMPTLEEIRKRNAERPPRLKAEEIEMIYQWQKDLKTYDKKIDNTELSPGEVGKELLGFIE